MTKVHGERRDLPLDYEPPASPEGFRSRASLGALPPARAGAPAQ